MAPFQGRPGGRVRPAASPLTTFIHQVIIQIFVDERAKGTHHVDVRRHGGEHWQFGTLDMPVLAAE